MRRNLMSFVKPTRIRPKTGTVIWVAAVGLFLLLSKLDRPTFYVVVFLLSSAIGGWMFFKAKKAADRQDS
ncbi:hypothetical protein LLE49_07110 [Alicyclobacillus tolerans]|uniref:hypothetical protein n=1 Tax=Alicyclobacillus tolerans TaxID=90970 RepID=UPI001F43E896|nr:hypothetical protein [Alicyclobacillus tolerans]MCF8564514.1 hypothetical protein [Alicyclobacillus tolerans]